MILLKEPQNINTLYLVGELMVEIFDLTVGLGQVEHCVLHQLLLLLLALVGSVGHLAAERY